MTIYRYYNNPPMCGVKNRRRIREYDPAAMFTGLRFHPAHGRKNERFLVIEFKSIKNKVLFELEFSTALLQELQYDEIVDDQKMVIKFAIADRRKKLAMI